VTKRKRKLSYQELADRHYKAHESLKLSGSIPNIDIDAAVKNAAIDGRSSSSKSVLFISDMHVGSIYAVRTPHAVLVDGTELNPTKLSQQLYDNWCWAKDELIQKPDVLCLNGEPVDGSNKKSASAEVWTPSVQTQLKDAEKLIRMYSWKEIVLTRGSRYHVTVDNTFHEEFLAKTLGCIPYSGFFAQAQENNNDTKEREVTPQYTDFYLWFILGGKRFSVCHHVGYNKTELYRTTALGREGAVLKFAEGRWYPKGENVDVIVRSHVHYYVQIKYRHQLSLTTPCWKMPDEFMLRRGLGGTAVDIGTVEVIIEPNGEIHVYEHIIQNDKYPKPQEINFDERLK